MAQALYEEGVAASFALYSAVDGDETLALALLGAGEGAPDVILADYHLDHERTGCEAITAIRRVAGQDIPAAIVSADRSDDTRQVLRARHLPILNKPVKPNRLRALLTSLLGTSG